jgi:hypothetical protein
MLYVQACTKQEAGEHTQRDRRNVVHMKTRMDLGICEKKKEQSFSFCGLIDRSISKGNFKTIQVN